MLQVESSITGIGILNLECAVLPPSKFWAARPKNYLFLYGYELYNDLTLPVLATHRTMPPSDLILAVMSLNVNVLPYPPGEFRTNNFCTFSPELI